jgi:hypothetical protein
MPIKPYRARSFDAISVQFLIILIDLDSTLNEGQGKSNSSLSRSTAM